MRLHTHLKDNGFRTWLDKENILPGQKWRNVIQKAIVAANFLVFCISRSSVNKRGFVPVEQKWALEIADHIPEEQIYLIPARIEECSVPFSLAQYQYIDLYVEDGLDRLTKAITIEWAKRKGFIVPAAYP